MYGLPYYWANLIIDWLFLYPLDIFLYMEIWENKWNEMKISEYCNELVDYKIHMLLIKDLRIWVMSISQE